MSIKVAITDDHLMVINGLKTMLAQAPDINVIYSCTSGETLLNEIAGQQPDILLLDIQLPDIPGTELCRKVLKTYPSVKIIAITSHDDSHYVKQMLRFGASGYLLKNTDLPTLVEAIHKVYEGDQFLDTQIKKSLIQEAITGQRVSQYEIPLTKREREILQLIAEELNNQQIADKLFISLRTVEAHRFNITQKLGVKNTAGLVKEAIRRGLI